MAASATTVQSEWQSVPAALQDDSALSAALQALHQELCPIVCAQELICNEALGIEIRAVRRIEDWRALLLLTPWMFARVLIPDHPPPVAVPPEWQATQRATADYQVLGPAVSFTLLGQVQRAHLNYAPRLGHYLLQPLCLEMSAYRCAEEVFAAWNEVIRVRDANLEQVQRDCPLQREISRREFFRLGRDVR